VLSNLRGVQDHVEVAVGDVSTIWDGRGRCGGGGAEGKATTLDCHCQSVTRTAELFH